MDLNGQVGAIDADRPVTHGIFISYRRDDTSGFVRALMHPLSDRFGAKRIFKDTDNLEPGTDFVDEVKRQLASSVVTLVVIGRKWLTAADSRHPGRRLDDENDLLRFEVSTALSTPGMLVIPVLVDSATMPSAEDLPADLQRIARISYIEITDTRWNADTERLLKRIEAKIAGATLPALWKRASAYAVHLLTVAVLTLTVLLVMNAFNLPPFAPRDGESPNLSTTPPTGSPAPGPARPEQPPVPSDKDRGKDPGDTGGDAVSTGRNDTPAPTPAESPKSKPRNQSVTNPPPPVKDPRANGTVAPNKPSTESDGNPGGTITPTPPAPKVDLEAPQRAAIRAVLERYRLAYNSKSEHSLLEVYPKADARRIFREQSDCARVDLVFGEPQVSILSPTTEAQVSVPAKHTCHPKNGQAQMVDSFTGRFVFVRQGESWVIEARLAPVDLKR